MSIYPVRLSEWYPAKPKRKHAWASIRDMRLWYEAAKECVETNTCCVCGKKPSYRYAWGMHAIPWGYGWEEIWCSKKCLDSQRRLAAQDEQPAPPKFPIRYPP